LIALIEVNASTTNWLRSSGGKLAAAMPGVGVDLLEIDRLERALERRPRLAERLFTDGERAYAASRARPAMHLAARFCAKEAVAKALQLREWSWRDVEVLGGGDEPPSVRLTGAAERRAAELGAKVSISLTHSRGMAAAVAVLT
jgi:holo-[acyl-carrier protein] synthase